MLAASLGGSEESQHRRERRQKGSLSTGDKSAANAAFNGVVFPLGRRVGRRRRRRRSNVSPEPMTSAGEVVVKSDSFTKLPGWRFKIQSLRSAKNTTSGSLNMIFFEHSS